MTLQKTEVTLNSKTTGTRARDTHIKTMLDFQENPIEKDWKRWKRIELSIMYKSQNPIELQVLRSK